MKYFRIIILISTLMFQNLYAYDCGKQYVPQKGIQDGKLLRFLGNCSWVNDGTGLSFKIYTYYDGEFYSNQYETKNKQHTDYINELHENLEKTLVNNLYFTNWKFLDKNTLNLLDKLNYLDDNEKVKNLNGERIIEITVRIDIYKYNKVSDLHYGLLTLSVEPGSYSPYLPWYTKDKIDMKSYLYDKEFEYIMPFAGYKDNNKVLIKNITRQLEGFISKDFRRRYDTIKSRLIDTESILIAPRTGEYFDEEEFKGIEYLIHNYDHLKIKPENKKQYDYILDSWSYSKKDSDEIIKQGLKKTFDSKFGLLHKINYSNVKDFETEFINFYLPILKEKIKNRGY